MKSLANLQTLSQDRIISLLDLADELKVKHNYNIEYRPLVGKTILTVFPPTSLRTKISIEAGIFQLGAQAISIPDNFHEAEDLEDVIGYINCWIDCLVIRHKSQSLMENLANMSKFPIINAMSKKYHPCEILSDLQTIRELRRDIQSLKFVFVGPAGNIANTWFTAAGKLNLNITQICPKGYEVEKDIYDFARENSKGTVEITNDMENGMKYADVILSDGWPKEEEHIEKLRNYSINMEAIKLANKKCIVNPCPPFKRGQEITEEVLNSQYFIGYDGKENLLHMQKAILCKFIL